MPTLAAVALAVVASAVMAGTASAATPSCRGHAATMTGTSGADVTSGRTAVTSSSLAAKLGHSC